MFGCLSGSGEGRRRRFGGGEAAGSRLNGLRGSVNIGGTILTDQNINGICSLPGDSGGRVFLKTAAHGIISASNFNPDTQECTPNPITTYPRIHNVEYALGVRIYTSMPS